MEFNGEDEAAMPLSQRRAGIETFRVQGYLDNEPVYMVWDGRWVRGSQLLHDRALLAMAVDEAFVEAGLEPAVGNTLSRPDPEQVMLAVLTCCDEIDRAEFEVHGQRRVIAPRP